MPYFRMRHILKSEKIYTPFEDATLTAKRIQIFSCYN